MILLIKDKTKNRTIMIIFLVFKSFPIFFKSFFNLSLYINKKIKELRDNYRNKINCKLKELIHDGM